MNAYPKHIKRKLNDLAAQAYELELGRELDRLFHQFEAWKAGQISADELNDLIHKHHNGPSRELYSKYANVQVGLLVAYALVSGLLPQDSVPEEVWPYLQRELAFYQAQAKRE